MHRRGLSGPGAQPWRHREAARRLARELGVIATKGLASYFLTVAEVVGWSGWSMSPKRNISVSIR